MLEREIKQLLGSITTNKARGGDGIPIELFQILRDYAVKVLHSIRQQIWKAQQWLQDWKRSIFIPIPKKNNAKECSNYCTIIFISHASKVMLRILQARHQKTTWTVNFQMFKLDLEKAEEPDIKLPTSAGSSKKQENSRKNICFHLLIRQSLWLCRSQQTVENSSRDGNTRPPDLPPEKSVYRSRSNSQNQTWNNRLVPNWKRSTSRLYVVILLI